MRTFDKASVHMVYCIHGGGADDLTAAARGDRARQVLPVAPSHTLLAFTDILIQTSPPSESS